MNGDIIGGCTDGAIRVFTKNEFRQAEYSMRQAFLQESESKIVEAL